MTKHTAFAAINPTAPRRKLNPVSLMVLLALSSVSYSALAGTCNPTLDTCDGTDVWDLSVNGAPTQAMSFTDYSVFNADVSTPLTYGLGFSGHSTFNATAPVIVIMGEGEEEGGLLFDENAVMNASVANALNDMSHGLWFGGYSVLNATTSEAISGGELNFGGEAVLNASASHAISGGTQYLNGDTTLNATASDAISGGSQNFSYGSTLNATASNAISGGSQTFYAGVLNATASNAISGGTQTFNHYSILNATASNAISGGTQEFNFSTLNATASNAISGGTQEFNFSELSASISNAISGGTQIFSGGTLVIDADNGVAGSNLVLNYYTEMALRGHLSWVSSLAGDSGQVSSGDFSGSRGSTLTINGTHGEDTTFAGLLLNDNYGTLNLVKDGTSRQTLSGVGSTVQNVDVLGGTLAFAQDGTFTTAGDYTTHSGATTAIGVDNATLTVGGAFTQQAGSTLNITVGGAPDITADTASLNGNLVINGFATPVKASVATTAPYTLIHTTNGISGDFAVKPQGVDYLLQDGYLTPDGKDYNMRFRLAWTDGDQTDATG
ncbi:TPA: hypothetical protein ACQ39K_004921, partial [Yersinia enterocolitica]